MNAIQPFTNDEFSLDFIPDGESFKVAAPGLARSLGFRDAYNLTASIPEGEKGYSLVSTPNGEQRVLAVTEAGFYRALGQRQTTRIRNSQVRESVERFQSWVYGDVLPSLRRAGTQTAVLPIQLGVTVSALAQLAHREHVVPMAGRVLAYERWHKSDKGIAAFVQLTIELDPAGIEGAPVSASALPAKDVLR